MPQLWTPPVTHAAGDVLHASDWTTNTVDNPTFLSQPPIGRVHLATNTSVAAGAGIAALNLTGTNGAVDFDPWGWWNSTNGNFVTSIAGYYLVTVFAVATMGSGSGSSVFEITPLISGSTPSLYANVQGVQGLTVSGISTDLVYIASGGTIAFGVANTGSLPVTLEANSNQTCLHFKWVSF